MHIDIVNRIFFEVEPVKPAPTSKEVDRLNSVKIMPVIAFFPLSVSENLRPALGRQTANFLSENLKHIEGVESALITAMVDVQSPDGPRKAFAVFGSTLNDPNLIKQVMQNTQADVGVDGLIEKEPQNWKATIRITESSGEHEVHVKEFPVDAYFDMVRWIAEIITQHLGVYDFLPALDFGTPDQQAFCDFLIGYDAIQLITQAGHRTATEFDVSGSFDSLISALELDEEFLGPYETGIQLARLCAQFGIGTFEVVNAKLKRIIELMPDDWRGPYVMGEIQLNVGKPDEALKFFEKALAVFEEQRQKALKRQDEGEDVIVPELEPALYTRMGQAQAIMNMPINAERSFKKALELEGPEKPTMDLLSSLLIQLGRGHEIFSMWQEVVEANPESPEAWSRYAMALLAQNRVDEAKKVFEEGLEKTSQHPIIKRAFAPLLFQEKDYDRAMDFYEDVLEIAENDVNILMEYAAVLDSASRGHEVVDVLDKVIKLNPHPDIKAQASARLLELQHPKRVEALERAQEKIRNEDLAGAVGELEGLTQWVDEYWKAWAMLATLYNQLGRFQDALNAGRKAIEQFPGFEPGYCEIANALMGLGRGEEAYAMLKNLLQARPFSSTIALHLAIAAKHTGRREEAIHLAARLRETLPSGNIELERALSEIER